MTDADNPSRPVPRDGPLAAPEAVSGVLPELPAHEGPEQRKLQAVWEHAGDAMLFLDCDGLLDCNDAGLRQFGLDSRDALLGLPLHAFAPPCQPDGTASRNAFDEGLARALLTGCERFEWVFRRTDLSPLTLDVVLHGVSMGGGQVAHGIFRDVTRQREAARQLELNRQGGERDGQVLGAMKNARIQASVEEIAKSLQGNWRAGHLFALKQALGAFDFIGTQLTECDQEIEAQLQRLQTHDGEPAKGKKRGRARNAPKFDRRTQLFKMCGVDSTRIDGIDVTTALAVISETGADMSRFPTVGHFAIWMGLCPGTKITSGKVMSAWRNLNEQDDPEGRAKRDEIGWGKVDFYGQSADRRAAIARELAPLNVA